MEKKFDLKNINNFNNKEDSYNSNYTNLENNNNSISNKKSNLYYFNHSKHSKFKYKDIYINKYLALLYFKKFKLFIKKIIIGDTFNKRGKITLYIYINWYKKKKFLKKNKFIIDNNIPINYNNKYSNIEFINKIIEKDNNSIFIGDFKNYFENINIYKNKYNIIDYINIFNNIININKEKQNNIQLFFNIETFKKLLLNFINNKDYFNRTLLIKRRAFWIVIDNPNIFINFFKKNKIDIYIKNNTLNWFNYKNQKVIIMKNYYFGNININKDLLIWTKNLVFKTKSEINNYIIYPTYNVFFFISNLEKNFYKYDNNIYNSLCNFTEININKRIKYKFEINFSDFLNKFFINELLNVNTNKIFENYLFLFKYIYNNKELINENNICNLFIKENIIYNKFINKSNKNKNLLPLKNIINNNFFINTNKIESKKEFNLSKINNKNIKKNKIENEKNNNLVNKLNLNLSNTKEINNKKNNTNNNNKSKKKIKYFIYEKNTFLLYPNCNFTKFDIFNFYKKYENQIRYYIFGDFLNTNKKFNIILYLKWKKRKRIYKIEDIQIYNINPINLNAKFNDLNEDLIYNIIYILDKYLIKKGNYIIYNNNNELKQIKNQYINYIYTNYININNIITNKSNKCLLFNLIDFSKYLFNFLLNSNKFCEKIKFNRYIIIINTNNINYILDLLNKYKKDEYIINFKKKKYINQLLNNYTNEKILIIKNYNFNDLKLFNNNKFLFENFLYKINIDYIYNINKDNNINSNNELLFNCNNNNNKIKTYNEINIKKKTIIPLYKIIIFINPNNNLNNNKKHEEYNKYIQNFEEYNIFFNDQNIIKDYNINDILNINKFNTNYNFNIEEFINQNIYLLLHNYEVPKINFYDTENFINLFLKKIENNINEYNLKIKNNLIIKYLEIKKRNYNEYKYFYNNKID